MSVSIKVKMSDSDEDPEIPSGLKKGGFNVTNCSNRYFYFHFDKSLLCRIRRYGRWTNKTGTLKILSM
jgi:hypothetical protein